MKRIVLILISVLVLCVAPVVAQVPTPTRPPTQGELASTLRETSDILAQIGVERFITLGMAVGSLVLTALFVVFVLRPTLKSQTKANQQIVTLTTQNSTLMQDYMRDRAADRDRAEATDQVRLLQSQALQKTAEEQGRTAKILTDLNQNIIATEANLKALDAKLQTVTQTLTEVKQEMVTKTVFNEAVNPLIEKVDRALQILSEMQTHIIPPDPPEPANVVRPTFVEPSADEQQPTGTDTP